MSNLFEKPFAIASDHGGFVLKEYLIDYFKRKNISNFIDLGTTSEQLVHYPVYVSSLVDCIKSGKAEWGIVVCGTGIGTSIAANRNKGIHAAPCHDVTTARLARAHNNANILALGARIIGTILAEEILEAFVTTDFIGERYQIRIDMIDK
jgi:ribose 5-phosphate isomerase B